MAATSAGAHTREEILSQPRCWKDCLRALEKGDELQQASKLASGSSDWIFIGCGSSYYVALAAAASWTAITGQRARAVPASEVLLFPRLALRNSTSCQPVLISRSGTTSEVLKVAEMLELKRNQRTLAITCAAHQSLEQISTVTLHLLPADEQSMVMTRSFTSMLLGLQRLAAAVAGSPAFAQSLLNLPDDTEPWLESLAGRIEEFARTRDFADYVFLGQGPFFGITSESMLKIKEMSCSYAQCFHTLEFRHGPKSIVSPQTLVSFLLSESGYEAEREVLEEVKALGGITLVVANQADGAVRRSADFLVELKLGVDEYARLAAYTLPAQLLGLCTGLKKGYDPDRPRNLSRVVILNTDV